MHSAHDLLTRWPALDVAAKRARLRSTFHLSPGPLRDSVTRSTADAERAAAGLWRHEPSTWTSDASAQAKIADRLGWLASPALMADALPRLQTFAAKVRDEGWSDVVLLGMGGSSLAPEVLRAILGIAPGWPRLHMLDSTDPASVRAAATPPDRTLYIIASKSGSTIEPNTLAAHFRRRLEDAQVERWAERFIAITDEGTDLERRARADGYRDVFINPSDIGGRYSAMSFFGLVPAALMGQNIAAMLGWAIAMISGCEPGVRDLSLNPAAGLGLALGAAALNGRDKLTLLLSGPFQPFGLWVEQLIAESTGKQGHGIVPIAGEPLAAPAAYGSDRFFVRVRVRGSYSEELRDSDVRALEEAAPVAELELPEPSALGAEFVRWEIATAVAGAMLGINPFDEPNVQQAKAATRTLLDQYTAHGRLPTSSPDRALDDGTTLTLSAAARALNPVPEALLTLLNPGDYFALLAYVGPDPLLAEELQAVRTAVRNRARVASMWAYGPRYLHSTGQLHKGGPNTGVFLVLTATPTEDVPIPGEPFSFATLELAQALGDFASLDTTGRRALHIHLPAPSRDQVRRVAAALLDRLRRE